MKLGRLPDTENIRLSAESQRAIANRTGSPKGLLEKTAEKIKGVSRIY